MTIRPAQLLLFAAPLVLLSLICGCPSNQPEAVLEGTWRVATTTADPDLTQLLITFDVQGDPTQITYTIGTAAAVTVPFPGGSSDVDGSDVEITATWAGNSSVFTGTLSADTNTITGNLTTYILTNGILIQINNRPATMTRQ